MPVFFFSIVECGDLSAVAERRECADLADAERYAGDMAREIIAVDVASDRKELSCHIDIADADRRSVGKMDLSFAIVSSRDGDA